MHYPNPAHFPFSPYLPLPVAFPQKTIFKKLIKNKTNQSSKQTENPLHASSLVLAALGAVVC